jgi:hypothetical protein
MFCRHQTHLGNSLGNTSTDSMDLLAVQRILIHDGVHVGCRELGDEPIQAITAV